MQAIFDVPKWPFGEHLAVPLKLLLKTFDTTFTGCSRNDIDYLFDFENDGMVQGSVFLDVFRAFGPPKDLATKVNQIFALNCFYGRISEEEARLLLRLDGRPGCYLLRMNLSSSQNEFSVDFLVDSSTGDIASASVKNLGTEYGLRWQSKRVVGRTMGEMLQQVPTLRHPIQLNFAKHRYWFGGKAVGSDNWVSTGLPRPFVLKFHAKNGKAVALLRFEASSKAVQTLPLAIVNGGQVKMPDKLYSSVEEFITSHKTVFASPVPVRNRTLIYFDTKADKRRRDRETQQFFTGINFFDTGLFYEVSSSRNTADEVALTGPVVSVQDGTYFPIFSLPAEIQKHVFSFIHELEESRFLPLVCRNFKHISDSNDVWQARFHTTWKLAILTEKTVSADPHVVDFKRLFFNNASYNRQRKHFTSDLIPDNFKPFIGIQAANVVMVGGKWFFGVQIEPLSDEDQLRLAAPAPKPPTPGAKADADEEDGADDMDVPEDAGDEGDGEGGEEIDHYAQDAPVLRPKKGSTSIRGQFSFGIFAQASQPGYRGFGMQGPVQLLGSIRAMIKNNVPIGVSANYGGGITPTTRHCHYGDTLFCAVDIEGGKITFYCNADEVMTVALPNLDLVWTPFVEFTADKDTTLRFVTTADNAPDGITRKFRSLGGVHLQPFLGSNEISWAFLQHKKASPKELA